jgi:phosphatidylinositol alpha-mannosyltransferase
VSAAGEPLSVALLNPFFWPEVRRGAERLVHDLAVDLVELGQRPQLITSHKGRPRRSVEDGFEIVRNWRPPEPWTARNIEPNLSHVPFSYRSLTREDPDVAHAFYPTDALAALRYSEKSGRPAIFSYLGKPNRQVLASLRLRKTILERVIGQAAAVTTLSRSSAEAMWRWFGVESHIVPPGVDIEAFRPGPGRASEPTIACTGAVDDARKRIPLLLKAFAIVRKVRPAARLLLTRPRDPRLAERLTTENPGVELVPEDRPVDSVYRESWVSGLTSYNEAFGLVIVESLACGTPVFGASDGGPAEIIDRPEIGRVFHGDDERDVARAVLEAMELTDAPGTTEACRARASDFTSMASARITLDLYRELLERA